MKSSPRSTGGMNSSPTMPSGTSASAPTNDSTQTLITRTLCRKPHGRTRLAYQSRTASKPSVNLWMIHHGFQVERSAQLPASDGEIVKQTNSDVSVALTTPIAYD